MAVAIDLDAMLQKTLQLKERHQQLEAIAQQKRVEAKIASDAAGEAYDAYSASRADFVRDALHDDSLDWMLRKV